MALEEIKQTMVQEAQSTFGKVHLCKRCRTLDDSFTMFDNQLIYWFNTEDDSTHIITRVL